MANDNIEFDIVVNGKNAKSSIKDVEKAQNDLGNTTEKTILGMKASWVKLGATVYAAKKAFDWARDIDVLETRMAVALGTTEGMVQKFGELKEFANTLGISFETLASSYVNFKVTSDLANVSMEDTEKIFKSVATAGAAMKLSADDMNGIFRALEQMMSKGTVQAEELRGQLGERLPGAFSLAASAMGVTTIELGKMMEQGELLSKDLLPKLADELNNKFADGAVKSAKSIQASYNRLGNAFTDFKGIVLNVLQNLGIIEYFSQAIGVVQQFTSSILMSTKAVNELSAAEKTADKAKQLKIIADETENIGRIEKENWLFTSTVAEKQNIRAAKRRLSALSQEETASAKIIEKEKEKAAASKKEADIAEKKAEQLKNNSEFEKKYLEATTSSLDFKISKLDEEYKAYAKNNIDKAKLDEWYSAQKAKLVESETKKGYKGGVSGAEKARKKEIIEMDRNAEEALQINEEFWDEYKRSSMSAMEYELDSLNTQYTEYAKYVKDKDALNQWLATEQRKIMEENDMQMQAYSDMAQTLADDMADALIQFAQTGKMSFSDMAKSIINDLAAIQIKSSMNSILSGITSSLGGSIGGAVMGAFANGAAFNNGKVTAFASGGVVGSPTMFPMSGGTGLMGEAGPEAIVPLTRTSSGDLGVKATSPIVNVNVQNYGNDNVKIEKSGDNINVIISQIASQIQRGTGDIGGAIESRYGLKKA